MKRYLTNVRLVLPDRVVEDGCLLMDQDQIVAICPTSGGEAVELDGQGAWAMPGLIDLHCDAIEKEIAPRPKVDLPHHHALHASDRRNLTAGITTVYHGVSFAGGEFGVRDPQVAGDLSRAIRRFRGLVDHRVHARYEVTDAGGEEPLAALLDEGHVDLLSFMDHSPGQGQFRDMPAYVAYMMRTYHVSPAEAIGFGESKVESRRLAPDRMGRLAQRAIRRGVAMASHDDDTRQKVDEMSALGIGIAEFPINLESARAAEMVGMTTLFGAPNILRGKSSGGNLRAIDAVLAGVCGGLCADYHPPALLAAAMLLPSISQLSLPQAVQLVTSRPAQAAGLADRGMLAAGLRADVILVRPGEVPTVEAVLVAGRLVLDTVDRIHQHTACV